MFEKFNRVFKSSLPRSIDLDSMEFAKLKEFEGKTLKVEGFFFTESKKYGRAVVIIANGYKINMPKRSVAEFEEIFNDDEMLDAVLEGHLSITDIREYEGATGTTTIYTLKDC